MVAAGCYLCRAANLDMFTRAEACFSESAREMLKTGSWIVPTYYGIPEFDKPILTYWMIIIGYKLLGVSIFVSRLPAVFGALGCLLLAATFASKIYGDRAALWAMMALASSAGFSEMASSSMSDMLMCLFEFGGVVAAYLGIASENSRSFRFFISSICLSLAFLTKGLPAILLPGLTLVAFLIVYKQFHVFEWKHFFIGAGTFLVIVVPWHLALYKLCGFRAIGWMYFHEAVQRFAGNIAPYNFGHPPYYMVWSFVSSLFPWSIFLPIVLLGLTNDLKKKFFYTQTRCSTFMLFWIIAHLLVFSLSKSNWGYYSLPCYPAACILIGSYGMRYLSAAMNRIKLNILALPLIIYAIASAISLITSLYFWPAKVAEEAQCHFSTLVATMPASTTFISHADLLGQYSFSDLILFKTGRLPVYREQSELIHLLGETTSVCVVLPLLRFRELVPYLEGRLKVVGKAKFSHLNFPGSRLNGNNKNKVDLLLVTN